MRTAIVIATGIVALTASVAAHADNKQDPKFCAAMQSFDSDMAELNAIGPNSTVAEVRAAVKRVDNDVAQMQSAAGKMKTATAKQFTGSVDQLKKDVNSVSSDATLQQVHTKIQTDAQNAQTSGQALATEAGCSQTAPQQGAPNP